MGCGSSTDAASNKDSRPASPVSRRSSSSGKPLKIGMDKPVPNPMRKKGYLTQQPESMDDYNELLRSQGIDDVDDATAGFPVPPEKIIVVTRDSSDVSSLRSSLRYSSRQSAHNDAASAKSGSHGVSITDMGGRGNNRTAAEESLIQQLVTESISLNSRNPDPNVASTNDNDIIPVLPLGSSADHPNAVPDEECRDSTSTSSPQQCTSPSVQDVPIATEHVAFSDEGPASGPCSADGRRKKSVVFSANVSVVEPPPMRTKFPLYY
uniref:Uncharacterized protein n=1 Tax=Neobodo designis TaxID=312471 RepID=A0A7S1W2Q6_NEODS|mmetsp:Transcript_50138/g.154910  ORF Transcript_50138/g.154910 Transcript_50138/m.154910 type:complete len:265 (+) Transcript_50138:266-1060(+)|eukprot:CAMPEP_0174843980 /NCGR_PEP_ID=MMETSP1114-20130205/10843_1 /TAXON_ID=312471 /ORGANISM="Neobodo designis, Strain CCAP 1951/1" /LENGTH=264 /DNA_ID=CAMNT_0016078213 /DNA_START=263 /DNA_END=1057 /DNA_ORIENTATION=+